jgi:hypothetical protein
MRRTIRAKRHNKYGDGQARRSAMQEPLWIAHTELASAPGHPFYEKLNELLEEERFNLFIEKIINKL